MGVAVRPIAPPPGPRLLSDRRGPRAPRRAAAAPLREACSCPLHVAAGLVPGAMGHGRPRSTQPVGCRPDVVAGRVHGDLRATSLPPPERHVGVLRAAAQAVYLLGGGLLRVARELPPARHSRWVTRSARARLGARLPVSGALTSPQRREATGPGCPWRVEGTPGPGLSESSRPSPTPGRCAPGATRPSRSGCCCPGRARRGRTTSSPAPSWAHPRPVSRRSPHLPRRARRDRLR